MTPYQRHLRSEEILAELGPAHCEVESECLATGYRSICRPEREVTVEKCGCATIVDRHECHFGEEVVDTWYCPDHWEPASLSFEDAIAEIENDKRWTPEPAA